MTKELIIINLSYILQNYKLLFRNPTFSVIFLIEAILGHPEINLIWADGFWLTGYSYLLSGSFYMGFFDMFGALWRRIDWEV
ncbi:MAG: hypothetical protein HDR88_01925 [Bacteroides sp.]|nr:hypothetical protein [Bacteroides sp.]